MYQFRESGLPDIFLVNGVEMRDGGWRIADIGGLQAAIARDLVEADHVLSGAEVRFLRTFLGLYQNGLAKFLGLGEKTIRRWESDSFGRLRRWRMGGAEQGPGPAERLLRILVAERICGPDFSPTGFLYRFQRIGFRWGERPKRRVFRHSVVDENSAKPIWWKQSQ